MHSRLNGIRVIKLVHTTKNIFQMIIFLYSPCPNLEGIKDALFYKFKRPTIGQNCSSMSHAQTTAIEIHSRTKLETRSVLHRSLVVDSTKRERRHCSSEFEQLLSTYIKGCGLQSNTNRFKVHAAALACALY